VEGRPGYQGCGNQHRRPHQLLNRRGTRIGRNVGARRLTNGLTTRRTGSGLASCRRGLPCGDPSAERDTDTNPAGIEGGAAEMPPPAVDRPAFHGDGDDTLRPRPAPVARFFSARLSVPIATRRRVVRSSAVRPLDVPPRLPIVPVCGAGRVDQVRLPKGSPCVRLQSSLSLQQLCLR
jgi:hypothetical protein